MSKAVNLEESDAMEYGELSPAAAQGLQALTNAGLSDGHDIRILFEASGFSLTHAWFKSGYPLPLHKHNADCLYYIISGSLKLGTEILEAGDGFFLPAEVPYTYTPGEDGVEILEFRNRTHFDIRFMANNSAFWEKAAQSVVDRRGHWENERRPVSNRN
ncbi:hypothetical protein Sphch_0157 [Sphingobium chlorophenolicum L-1]|uniref:Cupin 2 conserved barrel domain protein n=1 Tax=Sphingobium chlorophenolicum L-1 TaxID=690566 RepID=F6EUG4_SPHCR|nr:hypothetical protein [Sphingobium chlorophenolicum]AEG47858.1 hypothetical protein Sphch_0157 [Sphingobium chlorophenolicum L-1]